MRLYTVEVNSNEYVAVENKDKKLVTLDSMGIKISDINELIKRFDKLRGEIDKNISIGRKLENYRVLAPIPVKDIPANCIAVGNPCKVLREIDDKDYEYYYRDRKIEKDDLEEEAKLRENQDFEHIKY